MLNILHKLNALCMMNTYKRNAKEMRMDKQVLEIIMENLMNERLDDIVGSSEKYKQAEQEVDRVMNSLENMLDQEQQNILDSYLCAENHRSAVYAEISYRQGMKDLLSLLVALISG